MIDGKTWERDGVIPYIDVDGIALCRRMGSGCITSAACRRANLYRVVRRGI